MAKRHCRLGVAGHGLLSVAIAAGVLAMHCSRTALAAAAHRPKVRSDMSLPPAHLVVEVLNLATKDSRFPCAQQDLAANITIDVNQKPQLAGAIDCREANRNASGQQQPTNKSVCVGIQYQAAPEFRRAAAACTGARPNATECCTLLADVQDDLAILFPSVLGEAAIYPAMNAACTAGLQAALYKRNVTVNIAELCLEVTGIQCVNFMSNMCPATTAPTRVMQPLIHACAEAVNSTSACGDCLHYLASGVASLLRRASSDAPANQTMANDCTKLLIVMAVHSEPLTIRGFSFIFRWRCQTTLPDL
eukprot:SM000344S13014  [mRNA]  locus=s344:75319:77435:- [translate_table: standard]